MANFEQLTLGGLDYYSSSEPTDPSEGELWLPIETTNISSEPTDSTGITEGWSHTLQTEPKKIALSEDKVFNGSQSGTIQAVNRSDGTSVWSHSLHTDYIRGFVEYYDGVVYSSDGEQNLIAVDSSDGTELWTGSITQSQIYSMAKYGENLFVSSDAYLQKISNLSGEELQMVDLQDYRFVSITASNGVLYGGTTNGDIYRYSLNLSNLGSLSFTGNSLGSLTTHNDYLYFTSGSNIYKLNKNTMETIWTNNDLNFGYGITDISIGDNGILYGVGDDSDEYGSTPYHRTFAIDTIKNELLWEKSIHTSTISAIANYENVLYSSSEDAVKEATLDGVTYGTYDDEYGEPKIYYNGEWVTKR